jgi:hypothetical protein
MAGKKKTRKRRAMAESTGSKAADMFARAGAGKAMVVIAVFGASALALGVGVSQLEARAGDLIGVPTDEVTFAWPVVVQVQGFDGPITWPPRHVQQELLELAHTRAARFPDPLSSDALAAIGTDLKGSGLFERVRSVRRRAGGMIEIQGAWRVPVAAIRHNDRDHFVGAGGALLPISAEPGQLDQRVIVGAAYNPPVLDSGTPAFGQTWAGEDVRAGLRVLDAVRGKPYWHQVRSIDVAGHSLNKMIEIITDRGTRVVWGAAPGEFKPGEVETKTKLGHLQALFDRYSRIDAGQNRVTVFYEYTDVDHSASGGQ